MAWFKKKEKIPQLREAPNLPEISTLNTISVQPAIPLPPNQTQETIKSAIASSEKKEVIIEEAPKAVELGKEGSMIPSIQDYETPETTTQITKTTTIQYPSMPKSPKEPVFIKIDRYESAVRDLDEIKKNLRDIEATLEKVRDVKLKEDLEITGWSQEIANIKAKLNSIESRVFNQI